MKIEMMKSVLEKLERDIVDVGLDEYELLSFMMINSDVKAGGTWLGGWWSADYRIHKGKIKGKISKAFKDIDVDLMIERLRKRLRVKGVKITKIERRDDGVFNIFIVGDVPSVLDSLLDEIRDKEEKAFLVYRTNFVKSAEN